jgi:hypothetical protein
MGAKRYPVPNTCMDGMGKRQLLILLSLGSNQKPSGCLDLAVITAERATNCATEDGDDEGWMPLLWIEHSTSRMQRIRMDLAGT